LSRSLPADLEKAKLQPVPTEVLEAYEANKNVIANTYGKEHVRSGLLFHGTGALQYEGDKYGKGMSGQLRHPLDTILEGGLQPHTDLWSLTHDSMQSTSFATSWPYAKYYADMHQSPSDPLQWEYGAHDEWFSYFMVDTVRQGFKKARAAGSLQKSAQPRTRLRTALGALRDKRQQNVSTDGYNRLQRWARDVRSDVTPQTSMLDVLHGQTDIPGNFGAIITVSEEDVPLAPMGPGGTYEKRAIQPVMPQQFTSLAVPLNKVAEYSARVHGLGYTFPVLPIEAVEYHMSHYPIEELAHKQRVS
jgi:hypothetical protein